MAKKPIFKSTMSALLGVALLAAASLVHAKINGTVSGDKCVFLDANGTSFSRPCGGGVSAATCNADGTCAAIILQPTVKTNEERRAFARDHLKRNPSQNDSFWKAAVTNNQSELKRHLVLFGFDEASLNKSPVAIQKDPKTGEPTSFTFATATGPLNIVFRGGDPKSAGF